jgi:metal-responsive CopG/Arc/MetJ family transcriptional regulator
MDTVSLKIDNNMSNKISKVMKEFNFSTKTEFIRDSIRKNLSNYELEKEKKEQWKNLLSMKGAYKGKVKEMTNEEWDVFRNNVAEEFMKKKFKN